MNELVNGFQMCSFKVFSVANSVKEVGENQMWEGLLKHILKHIQYIGFYLKKEFYNCKIKIINDINVKSLLQ